MSDQPGFAPTATQNLEKGLEFCRPAAAAKSLQPCPTLCDPMDCSLPGSSVHGIFQARVLECVAIAFSAAILVHV